VSVFDTIRYGRIKDICEVAVGGAHRTFLLVDLFEPLTPSEGARHAAGGTKYR
jgi:hypothetical protein